MAGPLSQFLHQLGFVLLEHRGNGMFALLSPAPDWLSEIWGVPTDGHSEIAVAEKSPFLETFLFEADAFWKSNSHGLCQSETWIETSPTGREIPLQAIALRMEGKRFLGLHSAETQFRERVQLLQTARNSLLDHERLQREIQKKEILLHCIIHDLSQPLSVMSVALDSLAEEQVSDRGKSLLQVGQKASDQQMSMIRDILQVFSADLKSSLEPESAGASAPSLLDCAKAVIAAFAPVYAGQSVRLRLQEGLSLESDWSVRGEATRIQRIFSNLLENALRYSPAGSQVTIGLEQDGLFQKAFVDDEGPGLPPELSPEQVFGLFSKGKSGGGKAGLGLYFCRLTVERWGGTIGCESRPQKGSRFWFRLPKPLAQRSVSKRSQDSSTVGLESKPLAARKQSMRILLAEDQHEIRMLTADQLMRSGHEVLVVTNGQEALDAFERETFDAILMDEEMPVMNGVQALRAIRQREKGRGRMTVIALTGYNTEPDRVRLLRAGFDSVVGKPFRLAALDALFQSPTCTVPVKQEEEAVPRAAKTPVDVLLERLGGDEPLARKIISTFLRDTPGRLAGIEKALQKKDGPKLASISHALKGSVSIFGAESARAHCHELQELARAGELRSLARVYEQLKEEIAELELNLRGYAGQKNSPRPGANLKPKRRNSSPKRKAP